jgi:glutamate-5-semialdehyde dehydrogenase
MDLTNTLQATRLAARTLAILSTAEKNAAINTVARRLEQAQDEVLQANALDVAAAVDAGMAPAMVDRLTLDEKRWQAIISDLRHVADLPDPVGVVLAKNQLPNGLDVQRIRVPLGVIAVIYEARPNVTVDVFGLAIKSGNGIILRGGKETLRTNLAIIRNIREGLKTTAVPPESVTFIDDPDRDIVLAMLKRYDLIDLVIPRGGAGLHQFCRENSQIPVITGGIGICHLFVDESADIEQSLNVIHNAKTQRPSVCNALDTVLVHESIAGKFLPELSVRMTQAGVTLHIDEKAAAYLTLSPLVQKAAEGDFDREWLSLDLGVRIVAGLDEAIAHIQSHSTGHSDGILTENHANAAIFCQKVDSAAVYVNASTRFTDGSALGLGAEMAISTQKLHARGPMALEELTTYKWVIEGQYTVRG